MTFPNLPPLVLLSALLLAPVASALTCTVTATPSPLVLPNYTVLTASTGNVSVTLSCTKTANGEKTVAYTMRLTAGSTSGAGTLSDRTMFNGTSALLYNIYQTAGFTTIWGDTATTEQTGTFTFPTGPAGVGTTLSATFTGYGQVVANQDLNAGLYGTTTPITVQAIAPTAGGTTYTTSFNVQTTLAANCIIDSVGSINFGTYDPTSASNIDAISSLITRCTKNSAYTIALSPGNGGAPAFSPRKMDSAGTNTDQLSYNLYTSSAYSTIWGDGTGGTSTQGGTGAGILAAAAVSRSIFGRLFAGQDLSADTYSDTITVTVSY